MSQSSQGPIDPQPSCNNNQGYNLLPIPHWASHSGNDGPFVHALWPANHIINASLQGVIGVTRTTGLSFTWDKCKEVSHYRNRAIYHDIYLPPQRKFYI